MLSIHSDPVSSVFTDTSPIVPIVYSAFNCLFILTQYRQSSLTLHLLPLFLLPSRYCCLFILTQSDPVLSILTDTLPTVPSAFTLWLFLHSDPVRSLPTVPAVSSAFTLLLPLHFHPVSSTIIISLLTQSLLLILTSLSCCPFWPNNIRDLH